MSLPFSRSPFVVVIYTLESLMPPVRCPQCTKKFKDQTTLLKHMNQPISSCLTHFQELINIADTLQKGAQTADHQLVEENYEPLYSMDTTEDIFSAPPFCSPQAPPRNTETVQYPFKIKKHPTASKIFGHGNTFMDQFDSDNFASARCQGYLYYPFASRDEWELASFLLCSQMSLANIDRFLKLSIVSYTLSS